MVFTLMETETDKMACKELYGGVQTVPTQRCHWEL